MIYLLFCVDNSKVLSDIVNMNSEMKTTMNVEVTTPPARAKTAFDKWASDNQEADPNVNNSIVDAAKSMIEMTIQNDFDNAEPHYFGVKSSWDSWKDVHTRFEDFYKRAVGSAIYGMEAYDPHGPDNYKSDWSGKEIQKRLDRYNKTHDWLAKEEANPHPQKWGNSWLHWNKMFLMSADIKAV